MKFDTKKALLTGALVLVVVGVVFVYFNFFRTYTVTFAVKIGPGIQAQEVKKGERVERPADPIADGYTFIGWYLDGEEYDFSKPVTKNIIIEAKWEQKLS